MKGAVFPVLDAVLCSGLYSVPFTDVRVRVCWCAHMRARVCTCMRARVSLPLFLPSVSYRVREKGCWSWLGDQVRFSIGRWYTARRLCSFVALCEDYLEKRSVINH